MPHLNSLYLLSPIIGLGKTSRNHTVNISRNYDSSELLTSMGPQTLPRQKRGLRELKEFSRLCSVRQTSSSTLLYHYYKGMRMIGGRLFPVRLHDLQS